MIALTLDTDWAPQPLVEESVELIQESGCKVTVFCTGKYDIAADEKAIHPNFTNVDELELPISDLKEMLPNAAGIRSHCLFFTERLRPYYEKYGLIYDSNAMQYLQDGISCSKIGRTTLSIPIYFMDRFHLEMADGKVDRFATDWIDWHGSGLKVFDFHPIHVFLNTTSVAHYEEAKADYHSPEKLERWVASGEGIRTMLVDILESIVEKDLKTYTLSEIARQY